MVVFVMFSDIVFLCAVSPDEDNRVREDGPAVVPTQTSTTTTTTSSPVRLNPCTGIANITL